MQVGGLDRYMGGISPNSQKPVAVGASNSISGRASTPDVPEQVAKKAKTTVGAATVSAAEQAQAPPALQIYRWTS